MANFHRLVIFGRQVSIWKLAIGHWHPIIPFPLSRRRGSSPLPLSHAIVRMSTVVHVRLRRLNPPLPPPE